MVRWRRFYEKAWPIRFKRGCALTFSCLESMRMMKKETKVPTEPKLNENNDVGKEKLISFLHLCGRQDLLLSCIDRSRSFISPNRSSQHAFHRRSNGQKGVMMLSVNEAQIENTRYIHTFQVAFIKFPQ